MDSCQECRPEDSNYRIVYIDVVHRCNMECANCYLPNRDYADAPLEKIKYFIDRFTHRVEFRLIGGEPTLHEDLNKIIEHITISKLRHRVVLITNGLKLASKKYLASLTSAGLEHVYLSMNGFDDDDIYQQVDNLRCAKTKMMALRNCLDESLSISVGFIIVKNLNEHLIDKMIDYFKNYKKNVVNFEFRNIGQIGRNSVDDLNVENYKFNEIKKLIFEKFNTLNETPLRQDQYSTLYRAKPFFIHLHNWGDLSKGFDSNTNARRGRMTEGFLVAPFLEHIIKNEGQY